MCFIYLLLAVQLLFSGTTGKIGKNQAYKRFTNPRFRSQMEVGKWKMAQAWIHHPEPKNSRGVWDDLVTVANDEWRKKDPVESFPEYIISSNIASKEEIEDVKKSVEDEMNAAVKFATESNEPDLESLSKDVYL